MGRPAESPTARLDHQAVGQRIKALRRDRGWSQQTAAGQIGIAQNSVSNAERGRTKLTLALAVMIADTFEVSVDTLVVKQPRRC